MPPQRTRARAKAVPAITPQTEETGIPSFLRDDTVSAASADIPLDQLTAEPVFTSDAEPDSANTAEAGAAIDDAVTAERITTLADSINTSPFGSRNRKDEGKAKTTPPSADEWLDFFSRIVVRFITEWYVDAVFRKIDEDLVSDDDAAKLLLTEDERNVIARPFAEFANKNKLMRKHGRQIVAFADSFESVYILAQWFGRVNRIARKYGKIVNATTVRVKPEEKRDVNFGQSPQGNGNGQHRPDISGLSVFNPGTG